MLGVGSYDKKEHFCYKVRYECKVECSGCLTLSWLPDLEWNLNSCF